MIFWKSLKWIGVCCLCIGQWSWCDSVRSQSDPITTDPIATEPIATDPIATDPIATHPDDSSNSHDDSTAILAGHSFHGEVFNEGPRQAARLMPGTGLVDFPVTTDSELAQQFFNQGVGQLHGFWYFEAERSFRQAAALDGRCAMFYWGMAMANLKNPERAKKFIGQAKERLETASEREKKWIEAVEKFCTTKDAEDKKIPLEKRAQQYTLDLEEVIFLQPSDIEAKAFLVGHLWENQRKELATASHVAINALLQQIFDVEPMHPAHHYRIHLWDQRDAKQALASAALCGPSGPGIAHMWHMPGHIYSGLHRYSDAVWQMEASARVDHWHMRNDHVLPDQIHNYAHNNEWLTRNLAKIGRAHDALALANNMLQLPRHPKYNTGSKGSGHYGRQRSVQVLSSYRNWNELIDRADGIFGASIEDKSLRREKQKQVGMAAAFAKRLDRLTESQSHLQQALEAAQSNRSEKLAAAPAAAVEVSPATEPSTNSEKQGATEAVVPEPVEPCELAKAKSDGSQQPSKPDVSELDREIAELEKALNSIRAAEAAVAERWTDALALAEKSDGIDVLLKAEWQAAAGQAKAAWEAVTNEVRNRPNDVVPLAVKVFVGQQLLTRRSDAELPTTGESSAVAATEAGAESATENPVEPLVTLVLLRADFEHLRTLAADADLDTPLLARVEPVAKFFNAPDDWRLPRKLASDVGQRPDLETLGPLHWTPPTASAIVVSDAKGIETHVLASTGRAKIVLFYLGFGCLHCMEQLQKFSPQSESFLQNNIEVIGISSESLELLQQGLGNFPESLSIPLHADIELAAFKAFRCHDDFENQPLHGTFLIAPDGRILWQDIGHEPFMDVEFLKTESKRLLETWSE